MEWTGSDDCKWNKDVSEDKVLGSYVMMHDSLGNLEDKEKTVLPLK
jgi:hypothetical protein